jgi:hypothetical protein
VTQLKDSPDFYNETFGQSFSSEGPRPHQQRSENGGSRDGQATRWGGELCTSVKTKHIYNLSAPWWRGVVVIVFLPPEQWIVGSNLARV